MTTIPPPARVLFYSHDSYGTGHLRRILRLSRYLRRRRPGVESVLATGSPVADRFLDAADAPALVLPPVVKTGDGTYAARDAARPLGEVLAERTAALLDLVDAYPPDVLVVDHAPAGLGGELLPVLGRLRARRPRPRFVLLLRDIVGGADSTRRAWAIQGIPELFETLYDALVVFGYRAYFDPVAEYAMSRGAGEKTRFVGYLGEPVDPARAQALRRRLLSGSRPLVVGTVGGGEDGYPLLAALVEAQRRWPERVAFESILIGGPLMPPTDRRRLAEATAEVKGSCFLDEVADLPDYLAAADVVVAMAGFNTVCELFAAARPAVLVPRTARGSDQAYRVALLAQHRLALTIPPDELGPDALLAAVTRLLDGSVTLAPPPPLGGEEGFVAVVDALTAGVPPGSVA